MSDTWTDEEYYEEPYYDEYYSEAPPRTWPTWALVLSGCAGLILGFACAACAILILGGGFLLAAPADSTSGTLNYQPQTAQDWAQVLRSAGLEIENERDLTQTGDRLPPGSVSGIQFDMPSYCSDCSGQVIVFETPAYVAPTADWLQSLGEYAYSRGTVLLQIDGRIPQDVASQYQAVFMQY
jgi:hypothetical protein